MRKVTHIGPYLQDYLDGELAPDQSEQVEAHLRTCRRCLGKVQEMRQLTDAVADLPVQIDPPQDLWPDVERRLSDTMNKRTAGSNGTARDDAMRRKLRRPSERTPRASRVGRTSRTNPVARMMSRADPKRVRLSDDPQVRRGRRLRLRPAAAAAVATAVFAVLLWMLNALYSDSWAVERIAGVPKIAESVLVTERGPIRAGDWLTTDGTSRARLRAGMIGDVQVGEHTRLQLRRAGLSDHRIALESGSIHARIWAPPRLFVVETPAATAVDLGCIYTLTIDSGGRSILSVESGYVELQGDGRTSIVPAGSRCIADPAKGPGTAFAEDSSPRLQAALERYDFSGASTNDLSIVLTEARPQDALTLWQLLERSDRDRRVRIYDRLTELVDAPPGASRSGVIVGKAEEMRIWRRHLGLEALTWAEYVVRKLAFWRD